MPEPEKGEIIFFSEPDYKGDHTKFTLDHSTLKKDGWNDRIASFKIGPHTSVELYVDEHYNGKHQYFEKNHSDLKEFGLHKNISAFKLSKN